MPLQTQEEPTGSRNVPRKSTLKKVHLTRQLEHGMSYVKLVTEKPVERFLLEFMLSQELVESLILVSPIIGPLQGVSVSMNRLVEKINRDRIKTYVITNEPSDRHPDHSRAVAMLKSSDFTEIRFNASLHAKCYVCRYLDGGFALLGSGNLTATSIRQRIEIGMIIYSRGKGTSLFHELFAWGAVRLRTLQESKLIKPMTMRR